MFVRFRQSQYRLQVSLVESRRTDGQVRAEHIASLGSIEWPDPEVHARIAFWVKLQERLARLTNRIDATTQAKIMGEIHARIPIVTADEQHALQLRNAVAEAKFWENLGGMHAESAEGYKGLVANAERRLAESEAERAKAAEKAAAAKELAARIERGEDVQGGIGKPIDVEQVLRAAGLTTRDLNNAWLLSYVSDVFGFEVVSRHMHKESWAASERAERAAVRRLARIANHPPLKPDG